MAYRPRLRGTLCLQMEEIGVDATILNCVPEHTQFRILGRESVDLLRNKTITSTTNNVSANNITTDGVVYPISGTPGVGDSLALTAPGTLSWSPAGSGPVNSNLFTLRATVAPTPATSMTSAASVARSVVFPDGAGNVVLDTLAQTLTNKTLTAPVISGILTVSTAPPLINGTGSESLYFSALMWNPATNQVCERLDIVNLDGGQTMTNKSLSDTTTIIINVSDSSKVLKFSTANSSTGITTTVRTTSTAGRTITLPDATTTLLGDNTTATISNKTMDSAGNTLTITSSPLSATNINSVLNQDVRTTASPSHATLTLTTGLMLPTSGGTPTSLTYHEEGTFNLNFTGPFSVTVACNFVRIGKAVNFNMNWTTVGASAGGFFTTSGLPARLTPAIAVDCQIWVSDNSVGQATPGRIVVAGTNISVYKANPTVNFTAAGTCSFSNWSWTWRV